MGSVGLGPALARCADDHEGCPGWATAGECTRNPLFMHAACPAACGSCSKRIDELVTDDVYRGDWKHASGERMAQRDEAATYVATADEQELHDLDAQIATRRAKLEAGDAEANDDTELHTEL